MSQIKVPISDYWHDWPPAWNNMINFIEDTYEERNEWNAVTDAAVRRELRKVGARYSVPTDTIIFPNEKSYALWLLRFS